MSSGCGDVLSLEDLKTAKKHQTFEAEVITGRTGGVSSGSSIDYATNQVTGQVQKTMPAILRDIGFTPASFDFNSGGTLTTDDRNVAVLWPLPGGDGDWYYWEGALPKVIPAASTPNTTGGIANGAWRPVGDITLRGDLAKTTPTSGASIVNTTEGESVQDFIDGIAETIRDNLPFVTPEQFGAIGNGVADDSAAWQLAANSGYDIRGKNTATYYLGSTVIFPAGSTPQLIDGRGCTILWDTALDQPFDQYVSGTTRQGYTRFKSYTRIKFNGPVLPKSKFASFIGCYAVNFADGFAHDLTFDGWTNCFRVFGNTFTSNIIADNLRNAVWSSRNFNNHIENVKVGWCAGDVIVAYDTYFSVRNIHAEYAGVIPADTEELPGTSRGALISTGQDGNAATTNFGLISDVQCKWHGGGGLIINGTNVTVGGAINVGSLYTATAVTNIRQLAVWVAGTNNHVGDFVCGAVNTAVTIQSGSTNCSIGEVFVESPLVGVAPALLSAFDAPPSLITNCHVKGIHMNGFVSTGNAVVISSSGVVLDKLYMRSLGNASANRTVLLRGASHVGVIEINNPGDSSAITTVVGLADQSGSPSVGEIRIDGAYGTCVFVDVGCIPKVGNIYLRNLGNGGVPPVIISNDGTGNFFWGSVHLNGALGNNPRMNGNLRMTGFYSPIPWVTNDNTKTAVVQFPTQVTTTLS